VKDLPGPGDSCVYLSRIKDRDAEREGAEAFKKWRPKYQQDLIERCEQIFLRPEGREAIRREAGEFILCTDNASQKLLELREEEPFPCHFVLSKSEPFNEEMVIVFDRLFHWLAFHGISQYHEIHVSGYCERDDLKRIIEGTHPEVLIPVHTENPELMEEMGRGMIGDVKIPVFQGKIKI